MNKRQRENASKYLYDISKGIALIAVISNIAAGKWNIVKLIFGFIAAIVFYIWAYIIDGGSQDG